jgi:hypothetical protein
MRKSASMLIPQEFQKRFQIRDVKLPLHLVRRGRRQIAIGNGLQRRLGRRKVVVQVGLLRGEAEVQPFGKNLVMTVPQRGIGNFAADDFQQGRMRVPAGQAVAQRCQENQASEMRRDARQRLPPQFGCRSSSRFRIGDEVSQKNPRFAVGRRVLEQTLRAPKLDSISPETSGDPFEFSQILALWLHAAF